jgi:para-nitrobenzyl esterase
MAATMGAYHGAELPYVFDTHDPWLPTDSGDRALTRAIVTYWSSFAASGDPNTAGLPRWPAYERPGDPALRLDVVQESVAHPERGLCETLGVENQKGAGREPSSS